MAEELCHGLAAIPMIAFPKEDGSESYQRLAAAGPMSGDTHHPVLSQTDGRYDGHWPWINDKANDRVAKVDLRTFEVAEIKLVPNIQGAHGLAAYLPSCKYVFVNGELETDAASNSTDAEKYRSLVAFLEAQTLETKVPGGQRRHRQFRQEMAATFSSRCTTRKTRRPPKA